jgi:hypothetical protein
VQPEKYCFEIITADDGNNPREAIKKFARVFISKSGSPAIVVGMQVDERDLWYEHENPVILRHPFTAEDLGNAVAQEMRKTNRRATKLEKKITEWPAFKASGLRSLRKFEESFIEISVQSVNAANLSAIITGSPEKEAILLVTSTISTGVITTEFGDRILQVYKACVERHL